MADFLQDFSNLNFAAGAFKGAAESWGDAEDRKMKKMELESRLKTQEEERKRQAILDKLALRKEGLEQGPTGELQESALTPRQRETQDDQTFEKGVVKTTNPDGSISRAWDPNSPQMRAANRKTEAFSTSLNDKVDTKDRREHERVLTRISANPNVRERLKQFQNLDNALSQIVNTDHLTTQQIHEAQQAIRGNLGIKGVGGVGEREETYIKSLGLNAEAMKQFLTGNPADISRDNVLVQHIVNMARVEQKNIRKQYESSLQAASGGHNSMYTRRPDLRADLDDYIAGLSSQMDVPEQVVGSGQVEQPGLLQRGFLAAKGLLSSSPAQAAAPAPVVQHPQDQEAIAWARANPKDPRSTAILKANGVK